MAARLRDGDWRSIAEQICNEKDPAKLLILVEKLCCALDGKPTEKSQLPAIPTGNQPRLFPGD
ncbi:MAG: hypothetical protein WCF74_01780 [Candidatus Sulfotelmatobacter sp.]